VVFEKIVGRLQHSNSSNTKNFDALDGFRGLAILLVVLGHYWTIANGSATDRKPFMLWDLDVTNVFMLAGHGVQMFFVMSAFLLYLPFAREPLVENRAARIKKFYWRRFLRIYPAFLVYTIVGVLIFRFFSANGSTTSILNLLSNLTFLQPLMVFLGDGSVTQDVLPGTWSLVLEVYFYVLLPIVALLTKRTLTFVVLSVTMLSVSIAYRMNVYPLLNDLQLSPPQKGIALLNFIPFLDAFALGIVSARVYAFLERLKKPAPRIVYGLMVYLPLIGLGYLLSDPLSPAVLGNVLPAFLTDPRLLFNLCMVTLVPGMLIYNSYVSRLLSLPILRFAGIVSYSVFLMHLSFAQVAIDPVLEFLRIYRYEDKLVIHLFLTMPLAIAFGTLLYLFIERPFLISGPFTQRFSSCVTLFRSCWPELSLRKASVFLLCWYAIGSLTLQAATNRDQKVSMFRAADFTDENWKLGVAKDGQKLLLRYDRDLLQSLKRARAIILKDGQSVEVSGVVDTGGPWIHLYLKNLNPDETEYPNRLLIEPIPAAAVGQS